MNTEIFDNFFRFKIGDIIVDKALAEAYRTEAEINAEVHSYERIGAPVGMVVLERMLLQCHGGIQGFYLVRRFSPDHKTEMRVQFADCEVVSYMEAADHMRAMAATRKESGR